MRVRRNLAHLALALFGLAIVTAIYRLGFETNATTVALSYLLVVLLVAAVSRLWIASVTSIVAMVAFNYFFLPPVHTFRISDPQNWVALFTFLAVSLVASQLSAVARDRAALAIERAKLAEERKAAEVAQRSAELKSTMLSSLAHDLRTPLTAIRVAVENLSDSWMNPSQRREQNDIILAELERLSRLFQNVLEMTRIDTGAIAPERQWVHLMEIIETAERQVQYTLREHRLVVEGDGGNSAVLLDPRITSAALAHLLENAAQYSPPGTRIAVTASVRDDAVLISVEDQGPGIKAEELPRLFEKFYRGTGAAEYGAGTGMGLSITRGLVEAQHGCVWAENAPSGGARFSMTIPAAHREARAVQEL